MKVLMNSEELIRHMKRKGIKFDIVSEKDAKQFLENNNYYMKLASYRDNYDKINEGARQGEYKNLEFAYLQELSKIDMYLRHLILKMILDIEHNLKVRLLNSVEKNNQEDGYEIVKYFIRKKPKTLDIIEKHKSSGYVRALVDKYHPYYPVWVFVEVISFGDLAYLLNLYNEKYSLQIINNRLMNSVRDIRNAAAHSNCLINRSKPGNNKPIQEIDVWVSSIEGISKNTKHKKLSNGFIYDFTVLLYVYNKLISQGVMKEKRYMELKDLFRVRMLKNSEYFCQNTLITSTYDFVKKIVDKIAD